MITRLQKIVEHSGLSESAFASKCGLAQNALWYQLNGKRKITLETISAVLDCFSEISAEWLLRGSGSMLIGEDRKAWDKRLEKLVDVIAMQQEAIQNLNEKIKQLQKQ